MRIILLNHLRENCASSTGEDLISALKAFHSLRIGEIQGHGKNAQVINTWGDYTVYIELPDGLLKPVGKYSELMTKYCPNYYDFWGPFTVPKLTTDQVCRMIYAQRPDQVMAICQEKEDDD